MGSTDIKIPAVGESISSGIISLWHRQDGEYVRAGDALFTLDTDKVSTEVAAPAAGLVRIKAPADTEVKIGEVVGLIEEAPEPAKPSGGSPAPAVSVSSLILTLSATTEKMHSHSADISGNPPPATAPRAPRWP